MAFLMKAGEDAMRASSPRRGEEQIRDLVKWLEISWNSSASAGFATPFAEDADFINILGMHYNGRSSVEAGHRRIFDTIYKDSRSTWSVEKVRFVRTDVAIAFVRVRLELCNGKVLEARPTLTLEKSVERWQIVAFQNTLIGEDGAIVTSMTQAVSEQ